MQDMDPGPAKILRKPEKLKVTLRKCRSRMKRPVAEYGSRDTGKLAKNIKVIIKHPFGR